MRSTLSGIIVAVALLSGAMPSWAQTAPTYPAIDGCREARPSARAACGRKAYERWDDGSPARALPSTGAERPDYFRGGYGRFYGFGR